MQGRREGRERRKEESGNKGEWGREIKVERGQAEKHRESVGVEGYQKKE